MEDFEKIYREHGKMIYSFLFSLSHDEHLSEELTQETMFRAIMSYSSFRGDCKLSVWLCQIAKNLYYEWYNKNKKTISLDEIRITHEDEGDISLDLADRETVWQILQQLHTSEHLASCAACKRLYENMVEAVDRDIEESELDSQQAFSAISRRWKKKRLSIICISATLAALVVFIGCMVVREVSSVHDHFFPATYANLRDLPKDKWQRVSFQEGDALVFDSIFYEKEAVLDANSDGAVSIRILDRAGNIVLGETQMEPGTGLSLDALQSNTEYIVEVKTRADHVLLNFH